MKKTEPGQPLSDRELLQRIDGKMDKVSAELKSIQRGATVSGAVAGGLSGGIVSLTVAYIKSLMGA
ncbi:MAG: hypothetical protein LBQ51_04700 [Desulfovibrio sp.]|jgi:hypothetical protein|nr:hypothetical protein [Desulfovibrio sp.]